MQKYLDDKEKNYIKFFGEPIIVAHNIIVKPHVDIYVFRSVVNAKLEFCYVTKGMEEAGFRELMMINNEEAAYPKWPVYFLQAICAYEIEEKSEIKEFETFENGEEDILEVPSDFKNAVLLTVDVAGFKQEEMRSSLQLKISPLFVIPLKRAELDYSLENGVDKLIEIMAKKIEPVGNIKRESVV